MDEGTLTQGGSLTRDPGLKDFILAGWKEWSLPRQTIEPVVAGTRQKPERTPVRFSPFDRKSHWRQAHSSAISCRTVPYLGDHLRQNVIGAVAPQTGQLFSLVVDGVDGEVFQFFLDQLAQSIPKKEGVRQILILDNASWHKATHLHWHHFEPKFLPAYSPDFNPIERLWLRLKADWFWDFIARSPEELTYRLCSALKWFIDDSPNTASIFALRK